MTQSNIWPQPNADEINGIPQIIRYTVTDIANIIIPVGININPDVFWVSWNGIIQHDESCAIYISPDLLINSDPDIVLGDEFLIIYFKLL